MSHSRTEPFEVDNLAEMLLDGGPGRTAGAVSAPPARPADRLSGWADSRELLYDSSDDRGQARRYSGRVYLPALRARHKARGLPLVVYIHATVDKWDQVPLFNRGPEALAGAFMANVHHCAVAMPDMPGYGKDASIRPHPYMHGRSLAPAVLDMIQPSLELLEAEGRSWDGRVMLVGYSAGGFAAMAAVRAWHLEPRFRGIPLTGAACMAAGFRFGQAIRDLLLAQTPTRHLDLLPTVAIAFQDLYPGIAAWRLEQVLDPRLLEHRQGGLDHGRIQDWIHGSSDVEAICRKIRQRLTGSPTSSLPLRAVVQRAWLAEQIEPRDWASTDVGRTLHENDLVDGWSPRVPLLLACSPGDECVALEHCLSPMTEWAGRGDAAPVTFLSLTLFGHPLKHRAAAIPALAQAFRWCARQARP